MADASNSPRETAAAAIRRAGSYIELGRWAEASTQLRSALAADPSNAPALALFGMCEVELGRPESGLVSARASIGAEPDYAYGHRVCAMALRKLGRSNEALGAAQESIRISPFDRFGYVEASRCELELGHRPLALSAAQRAVELAPHDIGALTILGKMAAANRAWPILESASLAALAVDPQCAPALNNLGVYYQHRFRLLAAYRCYAAAVRSDPQHELYQRNVRRMFVNRRTIVLGVYATLILAPVLVSGLGVLPALAVRYPHGAPWEVHGAELCAEVLLLAGLWLASRPLRRRYLRIDPVLAGIVRQSRRGFRDRMRWRGRGGAPRPG